MLMRKLGIVSLIAVAGLCSYGLGEAAPTAPQAPQEIPDKIDFEPGQRIDSTVCAACHVDIYESWKGSVHANSYLDPVFQAGLAQAIADKGYEVADTCITCHSPATRLLDKNGESQTIEGVNCQFCHIIRGVEVGAFPPFDLDRSLTMHGPYHDAKSEVHETAYSPLMGTAEYCAGCHEFTGPSGATVLSTFAEYESGTYPELTECQGCHMPLVPGFSVTPEVKSPDRGSFFNSHWIPGGRDINQLRRAVELEIVDVTSGPNTVAVQVAMQNLAAGHYLPTGMPSRRMILEVSTEWEDQRHARSFVFGRRVLDADGMLIRSLPSMILDGVQVVGDTRLRPRQQRTFDFSLPSPSDQAVTLVVRLSYESSELPSQPPVSEDVIRIERSVR